MLYLDQVYFENDEVSGEMSHQKYIITPLGRKIPNPAYQSRGTMLPDKKFGPAFWTVTSIISIIINGILLALLIGVGRQLFSLKNLIEDQLVSGLYENFVLMDQASIKTTIPVNAEVPAKFTLPLETDTVVVLQEDTYIQGASVSLNTGGLNISSAQTDIVLPAGTRLPIHLDIEVPVDQKIPVNLMVNVDIPLEKTELHTPFVGLQNVVYPYYGVLQKSPGSWQEAVCGSNPAEWCQRLIP